MKQYKHKNGDIATLVNDSDKDLKDYVEFKLSFVLSND